VACPLELRAQSGLRLRMPCNPEGAPLMHATEAAPDAAPDFPIPGQHDPFPSRPDLSRRRTRLMHEGISSS
jgi:hypothetical protein